MLRIRTSLAFLSLSLCAAAVACSAGNGSGKTEPEGTGASGGDGDISVGDGDGAYVNNDPNFTLPPTPNCGDGVLDDDEVCDDGNRENQDGCYGNCRGIDLGYICATPGALCIPFAVCGDGVTAFPEQCDDGAQADGDGCDSGCKLELGFKCPVDDAGLASCSPTTCGDGVVEGLEKCEGSLEDGCTTECQLAPQCDENGQCTSVCGDGLLLGEGCDDGNEVNGDGCSSSCEVEPGYKCDGEVTSGDCETHPTTGECILRVPGTFRDFSFDHSDFSDSGGCVSWGSPTPTLGLINDTLTDGKPTLKTTQMDMCNSNFADWYVDKPGTNVTHTSEIILYDDGEGNFVNRWGANGERWFTNYGWDGDQSCAMEPCGPYDGNPFFFPVDGIAGALDNGGQTADVSTDVAYGMDGALKSESALTGSSPTHNFGFTSEVTYLFTYTEDMEATLKFTGDDDVYVFIGGKLALDLGGLHATFAGEVRLTGGRITGVDRVIDYGDAARPVLDGPNVTVDSTAAEFGLENNGVYDIKIFHAERQPTGSTFKLTLSGFETRRSRCSADCGDGILALGEQCDDGVNDGGYNECQEGCVLGGYCGDGIQQEGEVCDDADPNAPGGCNGCRIVVVR